MRAGSCPTNFRLLVKWLGGIRRHPARLPRFLMIISTLFSPRNFSMIFDEASAITAFLPGEGAPGPLTADLLDPATSASGVFGGEVVALTLNIAFSDAGLITHPNGVAFGDLVLTGLTGADAQFNGLRVRDLLPIMNTLLGGGAGPGITIDDAFELTNTVDMSFNGGPISTFGMNNLELPPGATPLPATSALRHRHWRLRSARLAQEAGGDAENIVHYCRVCVACCRHCYRECKPLCRDNR